MQGQEVASQEGAAGIAAELGVLGARPSRFHLGMTATGMRGRSLAVDAEHPGPGLGASQSGPDTIEEWEVGLWARVKHARSRQDQPQTHPGNAATPKV